MDIADLPLHDGKVPLWLLNYMERIARAITDVMIEEFGEEEIVNRLSDPLWLSIQ